MAAIIHDSNRDGPSVASSLGLRGGDDPRNLDLGQHCLVLHAPA
jgi:hypothetical protein